MLRQASGCAKSARAARRILALALVLEGTARTAAARLCGMDRQTLRDRVHRCNAEGLAGPENGKPTRCPPKRTQEQGRALVALVEAGPQAGTDKVVRWRRVDLRDKLKEGFGIGVHERNVGKHLIKLGYRRLSVRPHHPGADPEAQAILESSGHSQKEFADRVVAVLPEHASGKPIDIRFQEFAMEAAIGPRPMADARAGRQGTQQFTLTRMRAKCCTRPRAPRDQRRVWACIPGAVCPQARHNLGAGAALSRRPVGIVASGRHQSPDRTGRACGSGALRRGLPHRQ